VDFERVIVLLTSFLLERRRPFAVIGGVALAAYGMPRLTLDLDLAVDATAQAELVAFLEQLGYQTLHRSSGYSNHLHADEELGRVDVVYLRGDTAERVFGEAKAVPGPGSETLPVPRPEHLAAMKAFAIRSDPTRRLQELADIRFLLELPGTDRGEVERAFRKVGLEGELAELA
jgi:hypothetical protein